MATTYRPAPAVQRIAEQLIHKHHTHLQDAHIEYVYRDKASKSGGKTVWGKARKISGLNAYLAASNGASDIVYADDFFVIEIAEDVWGQLKPAQREALVDHELCHCTIEVDDDV